MHYLTFYYLCQKIVMCLYKLNKGKNLNDLHWKSLVEEVKS